MKTFQEFLYESSVEQRLRTKLMELMSKHRNNPEKFKIYKDFLKRVIDRSKPSFPDYPGRESARRDKHLYPSGRMSSHPGEENPSTVTKNPKKLRTQKAIGEIS